MTDPQAVLDEAIGEAHASVAYLPGLPRNHHALIDRVVRIARLVGEYRAAFVAVEKYAIAGSMIGLGEMLREERDRLLREIEKESKP